MPVLCFKEHPLLRRRGLQGLVPTVLWPPRMRGVEALHKMAMEAEL